jgi:hypothetical protein
VILTSDNWQIAEETCIWTTHSRAYLRESALPV